MRAKNTKKRAYFVSEDDLGGIGIVAYNVRQAKVLAWETDELPHDDYMQVKATWVKGVKCDDLCIGFIENLEALKRGFFHSMEDTQCPQCKEDYSTIQRVEFKDGTIKILCSECEDKEDQSLIKED